jgi:hypothetical protein
MKKSLIKVLKDNQLVLISVFVLICVKSYIYPNIYKLRKK